MMKVTVSVTFDIALSHGRVGVETLGDIGRSYFIHEYSSVPADLLDEHLNAFEAAVNDSVIFGDFGDFVRSFGYDIDISTSHVTTPEGYEF